MIATCTAFAHPPSCGLGVWHPWREGATSWRTGSRGDAEQGYAVAPTLGTAESERSERTPVGASDEQLTEGDVITNGMRMHYYRTGDGSKLLVLCHGFSDSGLC